MAARAPRAGAAIGSASAACWRKATSSCSRSLYRRAAAPRLRADQADRGEDERGLQPFARRGLSDADLPRGGGLRHRRGRGRQEALHHHRRRAVPISRRIATSPTWCWRGSKRSARSWRAGDARGKSGTARRRATLPKLVGAALENLRDVAAKQLETESEAGDAETRIVEILMRAAKRCAVRHTANDFHPHARRPRIHEVNFAAEKACMPDNPSH